MEERRESLFSQWEMTNAICPERSACVNPQRAPADPHPTPRPLHTPPPNTHTHHQSHNSVSFPWMCGSVTEERHVRARVDGARALLAQVALRRPDRGCRGDMSDLFAIRCLDYALRVCSCRFAPLQLCSLSSRGGKHGAAPALVLRCSRNPSRKVGNPSEKHPRSI